MALLKDLCHHSLLYLLILQAKFEDFFTSVDAEGRRTFVVAPNRPTYAAAYIQDKFNYKGLILRLGVRIDRYDANTKVLKDPFSLYEITQAKDFFATTGDPKPDAVGDDYLVYVTGKNSNNVKRIFSKPMPETHLYPGKRPGCQ